MDIIDRKHMPKVQAIIDSQTDVSSLTKAEISTFASKIGLSVSTTLTKAKMLETVLDSGEFRTYENLRKTEESWRVINGL